MLKQLLELVQSFDMECEAWISFRKKVTLTAFPFEVQFYMAIIFCDSWVKVTSEHLLLTALWLFELFEGLTLSTRNIYDVKEYILKKVLYVAGYFTVCSYLKSDNLQCNTVGRWDDGMIVPPTDGPIIILIDCQILDNYILWNTHI